MKAKLKDTGEVVNVVSYHGAQEMWSADVQYVHQLQNAVYFATDKEINIKL